MTDHPLTEALARVQAQDAAARTTVPRLVDALQSVLDLHKRQPSPDGDLCAECFPSVWDWPCPTVTTITQALEGETND